MLFRSGAGYAPFGTAPYQSSRLLRGSTLATGCGLRGQVQHIPSKLFNVIECLSDLLVGHSGDPVEPLGHRCEYLLLGAVRLLHLDYVADYVLSVLHVHFEHLYGLALGLNLFKHFLTNHALQALCPEVASIFLFALAVANHTVEKDLNHYEQVLMCEKHQVLQA